MNGHSLVLVANTRLPSQRAQALQVVQMAAAFTRAEYRTTLLFASRRDTPKLAFQEELWKYYAVPDGARPQVHDVSCIDWIDRFPRFLQYIPARIQELSFARAAARSVMRTFERAKVLCRDIEVARNLVRLGRRGVLLEIHRVPGGKARRSWLIEAADQGAGVVAISGGVKKDLLALGVEEKKIVVEHDGYELERFANLPSKREARLELGLDLERPLVVYTGGLLEWKGADLLVEVAKELGDVQFVVAGGMDADVASLRAKASGVSNLRIDGFQPPTRVPVYLAAADLGVVPNRSRPAISAKYTSPLKVFEAMAVGLPLVVSDLPSIREILSEEQAVFVKPDSASDLARGVKELLGDDGRRESAAEALKEGAEEFTWDARAKRLFVWMDRRA